MDIDNLFSTFSTQFLSVMIIHLFAVISPGPDFAIVAKQCITNGRKAGFYTSIGISLGIFVHMIYCIIGVGFLLVNSIIFFKIFKLLGGAYLLYIGCKSFISNDMHNYDNLYKQENKNSNMKTSFIRGFFTNVFNPKATLFFLSLFSLVIDANTPIFLQIFYGLWMTFVTGLWFCIVSYFFTSNFSQLFIRKYSLIINKIMSVILILISIKIIIF